MIEKPFVLSIKALVRDESGRCLVMRRSTESKSHAGKLDFPGGKIDAGETFDVALIREIAEETGLSVSLESVFGAAESILPDRVVAYLIMQARALGSEVHLSEEHDAFAWLTPDELAAADLCPQFIKTASAFAAAT